MLEQLLLAERVKLEFGGNRDGAGTKECMVPVSARQSRLSLDPPASRTSCTIQGNTMIYASWTAHY